MKKIVLFAAAGLLTTASVVYATVKAEKKPAVKKEAVKKESKCPGAVTPRCSHYCTGSI